MNSANPTALRIGMQGPLEGRRHIVLGRVVLGMELDGETYYWNEFYLSDESGRVVTLVFEETENGPIWKIFRMIEPAPSLSAREAAAKRVGDTVNLDGSPVKITLVDQSRVYHIEGEAPEGVEVGDVANYFNADAPNRTLVASWTGDEIEFYKGHDLPASQVETAFNLPKTAAGTTAVLFSGGSSGTANWFSKQTIRVVIIAFAGVAWIASRSCSGPGRTPAPVRVVAPPPKQVAPVVRLPAVAHGTLGGHSYAVAGHALVEVARVGKKFDRHEYALTDETGGQVLLVNCLGGAANEWHLLTPLELPQNFTAYDAAALRQGRVAMVAGRSMQVTQLFMAKVLAKDGEVTLAAWPETIQYGLLARVKDDWVVARWTETGLQLYGGRTLPETEVLAALGNGQKAGP